ncbi:MAG TPA: YaaC family protein [Acidimicrobiales bacterium]|nr:YaaC family protein [Acidimicrobiales bacterium]
MKTFRPFGEYLPYPLTHPRLEFSEAISSDLILMALNRYATVPDIGKGLFPGTLAHANEMYRHFSSYTTQAITYYKAAQSIRGSASSLPLYYSAMNFAKAELLISNPTDIVGQTIRHGLSYSPQASKRMKTDELKVSPGIFPLLYTKGSGYVLVNGSRLDILRLLPNVPEIGWELMELALATPNTWEIVHTVALDKTDAWSIIAIPPPFTLGSDVTSKHIKKYYEQVTAPSPIGTANWRDTFAMSHRHVGGIAYTFFESKWKVSRTAAMSDVVGNVARSAYEKLSPFVEEGQREISEGQLTASMYKSSLLPMPSSLARYAMIFYVSSLVRYNPAQVNAVLSPSQAWLLDSFCDQSKQWMLRDSLSGIANVAPAFYSPSAYRT